MTVPTWTVVILPLILVSGAIAYAGDVIGKNLGKKRLSLFGLRPKQTAHLFSIGSGVTIFLVTFALILSLSTDAREAMFSLQTIKLEVVRLTGQQSKLVESNRKLDEDKKRLGRERARAEAAKQQAETALALVSGQLSKAQAAVASARQELASAQRVLDNVSRQTIAQAAKKAELEKLVQAKASEVQRLEAEVQRLTVTAVTLSDTFRDVLSMRNPIVFGISQIIESAVIDTRQKTAATIRQELLKLIERASEEARMRGAVGQSKRAVFLGATMDLNGQWREEDQQLDEEARKLLGFRNSLADGFDGRVIVDVVARENSLRGREVKAELVSYPNELVFRRNDVLAQGWVEGGGRDFALFSRLQQIIEEGRQTAEGRRLRPRATFVYEATTNERVFDCLRKLEQTPGRVLVRLLADRDIRSADYLRVRFEAAPAAAAE